MPKKQNCFLVLFLIIIISSFAFPAKCFAFDDHSRVVRVGYYENEVFEEGAADGAIKKGYAYEYYRKLSEYTGWTYEYVYGDFSDIYQMLLDGEVDLVAGLAYTDDRSSVIAYPDRPTGEECYGFVKHTDDESVITTPQALNNRSIGVLDSAITDVLKKYLDENHVRADIVTYKNYDELLGAFDKKEVDILAAEFDGTYDRNHAEILFSFGQTDYYLGVNKSDKELLNQLNLAQNQLQSEEPDYIVSLRAKYYPVSLSSRALSIQEKNWILEHNKLTIGYLNNYLPYSDTDKKGNAIGLVKDVFPAILKDVGVSGFELEYVAFDNYQDMTKAVSDEKIDVAFPVGGGLFFTEEDGIYQSNAVASSITNLIYNSEYVGAGSSVFAVNENNMMQYYYVKTHYPSYSIKFYPSIEACLDAVLNGDAACTTLNGLRTNDILKNVRYDGLSFRQLQYSDDRCFGVKIGNEGLLKLLNRGINIMGQEYVNNLASGYSNLLFHLTFLDFLKQNFWIIFFIFSAVAIVILYFLIRNRIYYRKNIQEKENNQYVLEKINQDKTIYLKNLAHDLRIPINAINGLVDLYQHSDDKSQQDIYISKVSHYSDSLLHLVNDVLDLSSFESGNVNFTEQKVNINNLVNDIRSVSDIGISEKKHIVTVNYKNIKHQNVITDKIRLSQALLNVLNNSISFTPAQGLIDISVEECPSDEAGKASYEFRIKDNGIGMSPEIQASLFDPYVLEKDLIEGGNKTQGLGLVITKKIIDKMGGTINYFSNEGQGTECIIKISFKTISEDVKGTDMSSSKSIGSYNFYGKRVLLVEDVPSSQMVASKLMKQVGFEIQIAGYSMEACEKMQAAPAGYFDIIVIDVQDENNHVEDAVRSIRNLGDSVKANIPIIALISKENSNVKDKAYDTGITKILYRPLELTDLMEAIRSILK